MLSKCRNSGVADFATQLKKTDRMLNLSLCVFPGLAIHSVHFLPDSGGPGQKSRSGGVNLGVGHVGRSARARASRFCGGNAGRQHARGDTITGYGTWYTPRDMITCFNSCDSIT